MSSSSFIEDSDEDLDRESLVSESQTSISSGYHAGVPEPAEGDKANGTVIIGPHGTVRGVRNRVRAGLASFESLNGLHAVSVGRARLISRWAGRHQGIVGLLRDTFYTPPGRRGI